MKNRNFKILSLGLLFLFFLSVPFLQSFLFSTNNNGTIEINKVIKADFIQSDKKIILLFFGYVGCKDVCTPFLIELSKLYESQDFDIIRKDVKIIFVNLTPEIEEFQADLFAKYFNDNFDGIYLSKKEILNLDRNFALFFSQDLSDKAALNRTDYLYLITNINNTPYLKNIYSTHPLTEKKLIDDIITLK